MTDEIDQDVREAAADLMRLFLSSDILSDDDVEVAFARMKAAGREQGLREAAAVAREHGDAWGPAMRTPADQIASAITVIIGGGLDA